MESLEMPLIQDAAVNVSPEGRSWDDVYCRQEHGQETEKGRNDGETLCREERDEQEATG